jgi:hypothetical protein
VHIFTTYRDVSQNDYWVYAYYLCSSKKLVVLSGSKDPIYKIYAVAGNIKALLKIKLEKDICVHHIRWKRVPLTQSSSGYYAVKQFLVNAQSLNINPADDYLKQIERGNKKSILKALTQPQLDQSAKSFIKKIVEQDGRTTFPKWFSSNT